MVDGDRSMSSKQEAACVGQFAASVPDLIVGLYAAAASRNRSARVAQLQGPARSLAVRRTELLVDRLERPWSFRKVNITFATSSFGRLTWLLQSGPKSYF